MRRLPAFQQIMAASTPASARNASSPATDASASGVGTRAGYAFVTTLTQGGGLSIFAAGAIVTCVTALAMLWIGHRALKIPYGVLIGMLAGLQTQPAVLGFATEQAGSELPNIGYATVYPVAMIAKILLAQLLLTLLV